VPPNVFFKKIRQKMFIYYIENKIFRLFPEKTQGLRP